MVIRIQVERENDGRWIADAAELPGVLAYGATPHEAVRHCKVISLRRLADRIEGVSSGADFVDLSFQVE